MYTNIAIACTQLNDFKYSNTNIPFSINHFIALS